MLVRRISPAPRHSASRAHSTASRSTACRPPPTTTCQRSPARRASMLATTHCAPKRRAHAAPDRQRNEEPFGGPTDHVEERGPLLGGGGDVQERDLVCAVPPVRL